MKYLLSGITEQRQKRQKKRAQMKNTFLKNVLIPSPNYSITPITLIKNSFIPRKYSNEIYIKHIIDFIIDGSSWNKLKRTIPYADSIRKMFNKWYNDSIFYYAYLVVNRQYNKRNKNITNYYIDST